MHVVFNPQICSNRSSFCGEPGNPINIYDTLQSQFFFLGGFTHICNHTMRKNAGNGMRNQQMQWLKMLW